MPNNVDFYTETMAKVYVNQGYFDKAAEIYRHLLKAEPDRRELVEALAQVEDKISTRQEKSLNNPVPLLSEWIELLLRYHNVQKLKRLKEQLE